MPGRVFLMLTCSDSTVVVKYEDPKSKLLVLPCCGLSFLSCHIIDSWKTGGRRGVAHSSCLTAERHICTTSTASFGVFDDTSSSSSSYVLVVAVTSNTACCVNAEIGTRLRIVKSF
jgi:hypothetical protein